MKMKNVTITSKNQITLPAELVRSMHLQKNRQLQIRRRGDDLILTPAPGLEETLKRAWAKLPGTQPLKDDTEFQQIVHEAWGEKEL